jgi:hypothetical protein
VAGSAACLVCYAPESAAKKKWRKIQPRTLSRKELIEGEALDERVHRAGPLDPRTTIDIAQQVTSALAAAEKQGLVHRDLRGRS